MLNQPPADHSELPALALLHLTATGPSLTKDRLIEISVALVQGGVLKNHWYRFVSPEKLTITSLKKLSLTPGDLGEGIQPDGLQEELNAFCRGKLLVGYSLREQLAFLKAAGVRLQPNQKLCLQKAIPQLEPNCSLTRPGLLELAETLQLVVLRPWRAPDRLLLLWQLLLRWQTEMTLQLPQLLKQQFQQRLVPLRLDPKYIHQLPDSPGVYRMFAAPACAGDPPLPLYIGKSIHLRTRVKSHFSADQRSTKALRMAQEVQSLDWIPAAGDLGAQLKEAQQVKALQPRMNRRLRRQKNFLTWRQDQPCGPLKLEALNPFAKQDTSLSLGLFSSSRQARKQLHERVEAHRLCPALLGLEKQSSGQACFAHQLGRCKGACCGKESVEEHQYRLTQACQDWEFQHWPWPNARVIEEKGAGGCEYHALYAWQYLGSADSADEAWELADQRPQHFDRDSYRLLQRVLLPLRSTIRWQGSELRLLERK